MLSNRALAFGRGSRGPAPNGPCGRRRRSVRRRLGAQEGSRGKGKWIDVTSEQWQFLRGIYAMNPLTPPGLPYGDKAALATVEGNTGGLVFFLDGDRACTPMPVPKELLVMMDDVATAKITHEGNGL